MNNNWPTRDRDLYVTSLFMREYAKEQDAESLGLFELVVDEQEKSMNLRLSQWVIALAQHFNSLYGAEQGDYVTRQVISRCILQGQTIH